MSLDPYRYFRLEARELVEGLAAGTLRLEKDPSDAATLTRMLRLAHTLKGAARVVRLPGIADLAHAIEGTLTPNRDAGTPVAGEHIADLYRSVDAITARIVSLDEPAPAPLAAKPRVDEPFETVRVELRELDALLEAVFEAGVQVARLANPTAEVSAAHELARTLADQLRGRSVVTRRGVAVADQLVAALTRARDGLMAGCQEAETEVSLVRQRAYQMRLLPASVMFAGLERAARDAAETLGKTVVLTTSGGDVRLDAHVLGTLREALMHVVRNAVAHGIEPVHLRRAAGKPTAGQLRLTVERRDGQVTFRCSDDGPGLDVDAIRRAAVQRGRLSAQEALELSAEGAAQLLLSGGLTTTLSVDAVSGRGIGLDVVRAAVAALHGEASLQSLPGHGITLMIRVPLSLASMSALRAEIRGQSVWFPAEAVVKTARVAQEELAVTTEMARWVADGRSLPFLPLDRLLTPGAVPRPVRAWSLVVVESGGRSAVLGVDRIVGMDVIIVRPLPEGVPPSSIIAGATLDTRGDPQLVLEPSGLVKLAHSEQRGAGGAPARPRLPVLVIDDSLTTRMLEQSILESAGFEVDVAESAEEALERAAQRRYGVFVVDVEMPGMDGFAFVAHTRADPAFRDIPAVLVSSRDSVEDLRRGQEVGAAAYIVKSEFDQSVLLELIGRLVAA